DMPRPKDIAEKATRESRSRGGQARAEKLRAEREAERQLLAESRRERIDAAIDTLAGAAEKAAGVIDDLLAAESESMRLRAAAAPRPGLGWVRGRSVLPRVRARSDRHPLALRPDARGTRERVRGDVLGGAGRRVAVRVADRRTTAAGTRKRYRMSARPV